MAPRGPRPALWLPLVLLATGLARLGEDAAERWFRRQHIAFPRSSAHRDWGSCARLMRCRGLIFPCCKASHVFSHAPAAQVRTVCAHRGSRLRGNVSESLARFELTLCQLASTAPGRCRYWAAIKRSGIRVTCV